MGKSFAAHLHWTRSWRFHYAPSAKRGCTWPQGRLAIKHSLLYSGDETRLSPSSISVLSLPLLLNALCNILIKIFLHSLLPFAGCWLIMRSHCARLNSTQLNSTWFDGALRRKKERKDFRFHVTGWQLSTTTAAAAALEVQDKQHTLFLPMPQSIMCNFPPSAAVGHFLGRCNRFVRLEKWPHKKAQ